MPCKQFPAGQAESGCCSSKMLGFHGCGDCGVTFSGGFRLPQEWHNKEWGIHPEAQKETEKQKREREREREINNRMIGCIKIKWLVVLVVSFRCFFPPQDLNSLTHWFLVRFSPAGLGTRKRRGPKMS